MRVVVKEKQMPNCIRQIKNRWRVVECDSGALVRNKAGTPVDGGGHKTKKGALDQARAITINQRSKK